MATVVNFIDVTLQSAASRTVNLPGAQILLTPTAPAFHVANGGANTPDSITFNASLLSLAGTISFTCTGGTLTNITATSADLTYANLTGSSAVVTASITVNGATFTAPCVISKVQDGTNGLNGISAAYVAVSGQQVFSRATVAAAFSPTSITLTATPFGGSATYQWQYWTGSAWANVASAGTAATYVVASGDFVDQRLYRVEATIAGTIYTDQFTMVQVTGGTNGVNSITGFLTNESVTLAADNAGNVASFAPAGGSFELYDGITDKTGNAAVTYSIPITAACTVAITAAGAYSVSAMSADTASATLQAVYNGVTIQKILSLAKSRAGATGAGGTGSVGPRGAGHFYAAGSAWSDTAANAACPGGVVLSDVVTISSGTFVMEKSWNGSSWNPTGVVIDGNLIVPGSVLASSINGNALDIRDTAGNIIIHASANAGLQPGFEAPGTLNSLVVAGSGNLYRNTDFASGDATYFSVYNNAGIPVTSTFAAGGAIGNSNYWRITPNASGSTTFGFYLAGGWAGWQNNVDYVWSFYARVGSGSDMLGQGMAPAWNQPPSKFVWLQNPGLSTSWQRYVCQVNFVGNAIDANGFMQVNMPGVTVGIPLDISCIQIETGLQPSGWAPLAYVNNAGYLVGQPGSSLGTSTAVANTLLTLGADGTLAGGGGGKATLNGLGLKNWRVVSQGGAATNNPVLPGLYYNGVLQYDVLRSYSVAAINPNTNAVVFFQTYDVYGVGAITAGRTAATMAADLNSLSVGYVVAIWGNDEPQLHRLDSGLDAAMYRCGASRACFGSPSFLYRAAYLLVGVVGCGEGNGAEAYQGSIANDPNAWCDLGFNFISGALTVSGSSFTPRTLADYNYSGALNANYTTNTNQLVDGANLGLTAHWSSVGNDDGNRPANGATVGAPSGSMVGGTEAGLCASRALNGDSAWNSIPGINTAIADKLSSTTAMNLAATVTLTSSGALLSGTTTNGTYQSPSGFYGVQGGVVKFSVPISGDPTFGGQLMAAYGSFGAVYVGSGGSLACGAYTNAAGYAWPVSGTGFYLDSSGALFGNHAAGTWFQINNGNVYAPNFQIVGGLLTMTNPTINNPTLSAPTATGTAPITSTGVNGTRTLGVGCTGASGRSPYTYAWSLVGIDAGQFRVASGDGTSSIGVSVSGSNAQYNGIARCIVTDLNGQSVTFSCSLNVTFGTPA